MTTSQRLLLVVTLIALAVALPLYCLKLRTGDYYSVGDGRLFSVTGSQNGPVMMGVAPAQQIPGGLADYHRLLQGGFNAQEANDWKARTAQELLQGGFTPDEVAGYFGEKPENFAAIIKLSEGTLRNIKGANLYLVSVSAIYARPGMAEIEAAIGGMVAPFLLLVAALYLMLGHSRVPRVKRENLPATPLVQEQAAPLIAQQLDARSKSDRLCGIAFGVTVILFPAVIAMDITSAMLLVRYRLPIWVIPWLILRLPLSAP